MWKTFLAWTHALGFTTNETTVILFLTGAIIAGSGLLLLRGDIPRDAADFTDVYRTHDSLFAARSSALFDGASEASPDTAATPVATASPRATPSAEPSGPININTAPASRLEDLPGVGPAMAARIVEYRATAGRFSRVEDIMNVSGIGAKKFARMKPFLSIK
jgi:competence protein ComEA